MASETLDRGRGRRDGSQGAGAAPPPGAQAAAPSDVSEYRWLILIGLITAAIMEILDTTIVNVSLPQMAGNLSATQDEIGWVVTGYILSNVVVLPMTAWLGQRFGRKRYLAASILIFIAASFFCGTSRSLVELVFWRIIQGAGGAALLSTAQATLRQIFPPEQQGLVQAIFILGVVMGPTVGPTLGGYITDNYNWPWIFYINIPVGLVSFFLVTTFLHDPPSQRKAGPIDWLGIGLLAVGLGSLQFVLEEGKRYDWWDSALITRLAILAGLCLVGLVVWEMWPSNKHPVIDFHVLKNKTLTGGLLLFITLGFGLFGGVFIFPLFVQNVLGFSSTETGLVLFPGGLASAVGAVVCGRLLNGRKALVDPRLLILVGLAIFAYSMWGLGHLTVQSGVPDTRFALIVRGLGLGFLFTPLNFIVFASLKGPEIQQGSSFINLARQLGGSFGIAYLSTYLSDQAEYHRVNLIAHVYSGNPELAARQAAVAQSLLAHGSSQAAATAAALGQINGIVVKQSLTMSYNDAFLFVLVSMLVTAPAVLLLGKAKKAPAGGGGGH